MKTTLLINSGSQVLDFIPQVANLLCLRNWLCLFIVRPNIVYAFRRVSMSTAGMAWFDTITLKMQTCQLSFDKLYLQNKRSGLTP